MASLAHQRLDVLLTGLEQKVQVPAWVRRYSPRTATPKQVRSLSHLAPLTVVRAKAPWAVIEERALLSLLAARQISTARPSKILFVFDRTEAPASADELLKVLTFFRRADDVDFACGSEQGAFALEGAFAKILADRRQEADAAGLADPLAQLNSIFTATSDLRADSGRLSARKVAELFGLPVAELAKLLGKSRQSVAKTDDAASLQQHLVPFERISRLRAVLSGGDFRRWLRLPSPSLAGRSPLEVIRQGRVAVIADLAEDMLTGSPV